MTDKRWNFKNKVELYAGYNAEAGYLSMKTCLWDKNFFNVENLTIYIDG